MEELYDIPELENKTMALYMFINAHKDAQSETWEYWLTPAITSFLNHLTKAESEKLVSEIWDWDNTILTDLADPFLDTKNPHLEGLYQYGKIFLRINDLENEEYLIENIHVTSAIPKGTRDIEFFRALEKKIISVNERSKGRHTFWQNIIQQKIKDELS